MNVEAKIWGIFRRRQVRVESRVAGLDLANARDQQRIAQVLEVFEGEPIGGQDVITRAEAIKKADAVGKG